jgi:hypothetical protein
MERYELRKCDDYDFNHVDPTGRYRQGIEIYTDADYRTVRNLQRRLQRKNPYHRTGITYVLHTITD